ncbi:4'-phosphopantetheinyl transferase family protein [Lapillicoccus jejuensis]|uniref:4'-phosphopantetheinyl transferase n=1 Tax=Lapillicoccus jejuensis TaxID=402171 RepID=A0A542DY52_9MICO|nr:4'-phosphopantetheinyl transferase superfamily protein [Lapillicoccus jejuensis]TQJ08032.1 4'-phosphopantetheinyl transferase [Lapillicoccus jejuensis]
MTDVTVWWVQDDGDPDTAHTLLRRAVARRLGVAAARLDIGHRCPACGSTEHGRPVLNQPARRGLHLSVARAPGLAAVAVSSVGPVGVDVDESARFAFAGFATVALHPTEDRVADPRARATTWVRKESVLKAAGTGLHLDPRRVAVGPAHEPPRVDVPPPGLEPGGLWVTDVAVLDTHTAAVTVLARVAPRVDVVAPERTGRRR